MRNPDSLVALSVQLRLIWVLETALAVRFVGGAGKVPAATVVVALVGPA
jgi:hypothetical protein